VEYQIIRRNHFFEAICNLGIELWLRDKDNLKELFIPMMSDFLSVKDIVHVFENLGIREDIPKSTKFMNFEVLDGDGIRIFNRIIKYLKYYQIQSLDANAETNKKIPNIRF
jgi:hypothetical protein